MPDEYELCVHSQATIIMFLITASRRVMSDSRCKQILIQNGKFKIVFELFKNFVFMKNTFF